jgi:hypothetical protein
MTAFRTVLSRSKPLEHLQGQKIEIDNLDRTSVGFDRQKLSVLRQPAKAFWICSEGTTSLWEQRFFLAGSAR